ncbi:PH domain leucine-rich repeat-containing protein phosphatase 2 isoform X3 [Bos javanicus]|uniref:PH domain leucine-rich repeat-containing protein phosphatase 2 n=3 Tax=Bos TaxID=9903 RepID=A0A3Q1LZ23_BOVIN|nr:PH domain leucine-rich repeat-containing protein phosphatase 2 isoform X3 [Bos taurus]XP_061243786.1 PH domain leucine-rich repeat-containing protein phosphatase 2 isoform X3 [Bos javanicus]
MGEVEPGPAGPLEPPEPPEAPASRRPGGIRVLKRNMKRNGSRNCLNRRSRFGSRERDWLREDVKRGCVYLYGADTTTATTTTTSSASSSSSDLHLVLCTVETPASEICAGEGRESLYLQLHGDLVRRLEPTERPLQIVYDYLSRLGFDDPARIQEEAANPDLGCMLRFYGEKPCQMDHLDRILLSGIYNVRKGKTQLHKWAERLVVLCGTCLIVSSVKDCQTGKMHILPLVGGKVEEVKRRQYSLAFSSAGAQAQTYLVSFETLAEYQRWQRQASKVVSQRISTVDLSCHSLEEVPEHLFYSQDITYLNLRHNFMQLERPGGLDTFYKFSQLKGLNLSHNKLGSFPVLLCEIPTLTELNLSCNGFHDLPSQIGSLLNLQTLCLDGNFLTALPEELGNLQQLSSLGISFNNFSQIPEVYEKLTMLDKVFMAGNRVEVLNLGVLKRMSHVKHVDLRMNHLKTMIIENLEGNKYITHMDLRDNRLTDLDLSSLCNLEQLHCERNQLRELTLSGFSLRTLYANSNRLTTVNVYPVPSLLTSLELSRNLLECVPDWACEAKKIEILDVSYNLLTEVPMRILSSLSLRKLMVGHNHVQSLPTLVEHIPLEVLDVQHNLLTRLPDTLFSKALNKLNKLEQLEELNLSGNKLKTIPTTIANCKRLHTLVAHSNHISIFPEILQLPQIQFVDLSCNDLTEILIPEALPATLQDLDLTGNTNLVLEHKTLDTFSHITTLKIDQKPLPTTDSTVTSTFWSHGLAEMAGQRNKLCVSALAVDNFAEGVGAVYGMFDGDRNEELPRLLQCTMADVLLEEVQQSTNDTVFMANTFLVSHRKLGMAGQKLGCSALLCYIRPDTADPMNSFSLTVANVGTCQAVLCRGGKPVPLSKVFSLEQDPEEAQRVKDQKAIITEDNKVNGVTCCTRLLGCTYLYPWILPKPHISSTPLTIQDELLILGNKALWEHLSYTEAVNAVRHVQDPLAAAKKLCTLSQSYGCQDNVGAMVVYLNIGEEGCTCEMNGLTLPGPMGFASTTIIKDPPKPTTPSSSSGIASEFSSEMSTSEVSSEVGSTASDEHNTVGLDAGLLPRPERRCSLHPAPTSGVFQRQPSCATFSSNQSDNGLDSDDDQPVEGVITNGSKVEVEVDIHCCRGRDLENSPTLPENSPAPCPEDRSRGSLFGIRRQNSVNSGILLPVSKDRTELQKSPSTSCLYGKKLSNGSIVPLEDSLNLIEVATEAPKKKTGYFAAPTQLEPEDQFVIPRDLEEEVKEQMKHHQESRHEPEPSEEDRTELPEEFDTAL